MSKVLVIGCGGVASVAISKCCQVSDVFTELCIASRTKSKCDALRGIICQELTPRYPMDLDGKPAVILVIGVNGVGTAGELTAAGAAALADTPS